jgi:hypothetical protein
MAKALLTSASGVNNPPALLSMVTSTITRWFSPMHQVMFTAAVEAFVIFGGTILRNRWKSRLAKEPFGWLVLPTRVFKTTLISQPLRVSGGLVVVELVAKIFSWGADLQRLIFLGFVPPVVIVLVTVASIFAGGNRTLVADGVRSAQRWDELFSLIDDLRELPGSDFFLGLKPVSKGRFPDAWSRNVGLAIVNLEKGIKNRRPDRLEGALESLEKLVLEGRSSKKEFPPLWLFFSPKVLLLLQTMYKEHPQFAEKTAERLKAALYTTSSGVPPRTPFWDRLRPRPFTKRKSSGHAEGPRSQEPLQRTQR